VNALMTRAGLSAAVPNMLPGASYISCMPPTSMMLPVIIVSIVVVGISDKQ
jgi:hypothetical protein